MPVNIDLAPIMDRVTAGLQWLEQKQMYIWTTERTIEKLKKSRNELKYTILDVECKIDDAWRNGWTPKNRAKGWVTEGEEIMRHADKTVAKFDEQLLLLLNSDSTMMVQVFYCPCEVLSRRVLNAEAVTRFVDIKEHREKGETLYLKEASSGFEAVACKLDLHSSSMPSQAYIPPPLPTRVVHLKTPLLLNTHRPSFEFDQHKALIASGVDIDKLKLRAVPQYRALARSQSQEMPVMISVKAPRYARWSRAPINLVMVLDISSGGDERLKQTKQGAMFVVHNLDADDRITILQPFHTRTHRLFPLTSMTDENKTMAKAKITQLFLLHGSATTDILAATKTAYQILEEGGTEENNHCVSSVMLLTDGNVETKMSTIAQLSSSGGYHYPTYTLGIGSDHNPCTMYDLATQGHGTYSFVDGRDSKSIRNAMALCIGGLTSTVVQHVKISISLAQSDVKISRIACGAYDHDVDDGKTSGWIMMDDLCGNEEKNVLVYIKIPVAQGMLRKTTKLLTAKANYYCHVTKADVKTTEAIEVSVKRPIRVRGQPIRNIFPQVTSEVMRASFLERVNVISARSRSNSDGDLKMMRSIISDELKSIPDSIIGDTNEPAKDKWQELSMEMDNMQDVATGLAYMLSWLSSHQWQRAATTPGSASNTSSNFRTSRMNNMIDSVESAPV